MQSYTINAVTVYGFLHFHLTLGTILARRTWCIECGAFYIYFYSLAKKFPK